MRQLNVVSVVALIVAMTVLCNTGSVLAQGLGVQFVNFEAPAHKPITVVDVGGSDYLLVANGPDNSVEVWDTANNRFVLRVPTGQRPVTVVAKPTPLSAAGDRQIYVANWLGDSLTIFDLAPNTGPGPALKFNWVRSQPIGDEPTGIAFLPENPADPNTQPGGAFHELVFVTFSAQAGWGIFYPGSLAPVLTNPFTGHLELMVPAAGSTPVRGVRDPRAIAFAPPPSAGSYADQLWVLNFRGGNTATYDLDLWGSSNLPNAISTGMSDLPAHGGFGTTNSNMAFASNGDLYVVGTRARNRDVPNFITSVGEPIHKAHATNETGFVVSFLARLPRPGVTGQRLDFLDLNDSSQGQTTPPPQDPVAVTQPTDVVVYETPTRTRVFTTGFNSDTLAAVDTTGGLPAAWTVNRVDVKVGGGNDFRLQNTAGIMRGPRGLALKTSGQPSAHRLYVYNRLESSVTPVNPNTLAVGTTFLLQGQVEPPHVTNGRKFLYSSKLSPSGNSSCAVCHNDGNTDFLAWNLADNVPTVAPGQPNALPGALGPNATNKGPMVTQPLRGLVNFEVDDNVMQDYFFSNRPYHWRGDRGFVEQFNGAFSNLLGLPNITPSPPTPHFNAALATADMRIFRDFMFSMHYPPNPNQQWDRVYTGTLLDAQNPPQNPLQELIQINNEGIGSGGLLGLKAFHIAKSVGSACVHCHSLPEGSNNHITEDVANSQAPGFPNQRMETAQLKGTQLKEKRLIRVQNGAFQFLPTQATNAVTHEFGLIHTGESTIGAFGSKSINDFVNGFGGLVTQKLKDAVSLFVREYDSGTAPLVGFTYTLSVPEYSANPVGFQQLIGLLESQRLVANVGIAVHARLNQNVRGFWYDVTMPPPSNKPYHEIAQPGQAALNPLTTIELLNFLDASMTVDVTNLLTFHFTPLGSSRRVARIQGGLGTPLAGSAPTNVVLQPGPTNTANVDVPKMVLEWLDLITTQLQGVFAQVFLDRAPNAPSVALFELSLVNHAPATATPPRFGMSALRHEAPRRFQVTGTGIKEGAYLWVYAPVPGDIATATATTPPTTTPNAASNPLYFLMPLYPARIGAAQTLVWETGVELEPLQLLFQMNGGWANPTAVTAFFDPGNSQFFDGAGNILMRTQNQLDPAKHNWHYVQVVNITPAGPVFSAGSWQRLTITP